LFLPRSSSLIRCRSLSAQRQVHAVSVKTEPQSDDDLASPPPSRKAKGKSRALTASPASDENPFLDTPPQKYVLPFACIICHFLMFLSFPRPSHPVPVPKLTTSSKKPSAETPSQKYDLSFLHFLSLSYLFILPQVCSSYPCTQSPQSHCQVGAAAARSVGFQQEGQASYPQYLAHQDQQRF